jgi:CRISPR/Cas system Type II protein with McrA/HNH and RuvC-like nuclease domain
MKGTFSTQERIQIYIRDDGYCKLCGKKVSPFDFHAEHIVPFSAEGETSLKNGQLLCAECNLKKSDILPSSILSDMKRMQAQISSLQQQILEQKVSPPKKHKPEKLKEIKIPELGFKFRLGYKKYKNTRNKKWFACKKIDGKWVNICLGESRKQAKEKIIQYLDRRVKKTERVNQYGKE